MERVIPAPVATNDVTPQGDRAPGWRRASRHGPLAAVALTCAISLIALRRELVQVPYLNDSAVHEEMVRFALAKIRSGHFPPDSWFPLLNLGSPQFLHYQSLGAMVTAVLAWALGVGRAFTITTWLLVSCWPVCIYGASRLFGFSRLAATAAAVLSPLISSFTHVGYEQFAYLWSGYGLWSQLWAMWTLPFAWALSWRAVGDRRYLAPAAVVIAATAAFHYETGYLAFAAVIVFLAVHPARRRTRLANVALLAGGALFLSAWVIVPLVAQGRWAAINQFLQTGPSGVDANSYGARRILAALVEGNLFDWHHVVLITPLVGIGLLLGVGRGRSPGRAGDPGRPAVALFIVSLLLFFGRPTLGPVLHLLPGARDLFLRRFIIGVQLAGLLLAGIGAEFVVVSVLARTRAAPARRRAPREDLAPPLAVLALGGVALLGLIPAWSFVLDQARANTSFISSQAVADRHLGAIDQLIATVQRLGNGRVFAGDPTDWGPGFAVGDVPVFKYLAARGVDEVGFTLRTASLMSDPEAAFDEDDPADYAAFGVRFLILPRPMAAPVPARRIEERGDAALWEIPNNGYIEIVDTRGSVQATSGDLGSFAGAFLADLPLVGPVFPTVAYAGGRAAPATLRPGETSAGSPGRVLASRTALDDGRATATVRLARTAIVLLSASFDPGWQATVDGRPVATEMIAPALVGVRVGPGVHVVGFIYKGFPDYPQLFGLGLLALVLLAALGRAGASFDRRRVNRPGHELPRRRGAGSA